MIQYLTNVFDDSSIDYILNLDEVKKAKQKLETQNSVYFNIHLSSHIQQTLYDKFGLNLTQVPMRWIKGDTKPHNDICNSNFNDTYIIYISDCNGQLLIEDNSYPIQQNIGYVFSEGLKHETINTGETPRLLLGPMNENGLSVGAGIGGPGGSIIYFRQTDDGIQYSFDQTNWTTLDAFFFPLYIYNSDITLGILELHFLTDITLNNSVVDGTTKYFYPITSNIQFGSKSLNTNGAKPIIYIDGITNYPGFISNGNNSSNGYNNIYVFNLEIRVMNDATLLSNAGYFGQQYFAKGASGCYIINCSSYGNIIDAGGGIVGGYSASDGGNLNIIMCYSSGDSGTYSGGICGYFGGRNGGNITCEMCFTSGSIGINAGGIYGYSTGDVGSTIIAKNCYSLGSIGNNAGGIFGDSTFSGTAENCYSFGSIGTNAGGIFGSYAANDGGTTLAKNCYSLGIVVAENGIYGSNKQSGATSINCYSANDDWNSTTANSLLTGVPNLTHRVGATWYAYEFNQPYTLSNFGFTPYNSNIIIITDNIPTLVSTFSQSISANSQSISSVNGGIYFTLIDITGGNTSSYDTFSIDSTLGFVNTTSNTNSGTYTIFIKNSFVNISKLILTVTNNNISNNTPLYFDSFRIYGDIYRKHKNIY